MQRRVTLRENEKTGRGRKSALDIFFCLRCFRVKVPVKTEEAREACLAGNYKTVLVSESFTAHAAEQVFLFRQAIKVFKAVCGADH